MSNNLKINYERNTGTVGLTITGLMENHMRDWKIKEVLFRILRDFAANSVEAIAHDLCTIRRKLQSTKEGCNE